MDPTSDSPEGWTSVPKRKSARARTRLAPDVLISTPLSLPDVEREFHARSKDWTRSICRRETLALLDRIRPDAGWGVRTAICLASGSFSTDNATNRRRTHAQFAVFLDVVSHLPTDDGRVLCSTLTPSVSLSADSKSVPSEPESLTSKSDSRVRVLAQEPLYNSVDREFLRARGVEVLEISRALDRETDWRSGGRGDLSGDKDAYPSLDLGPATGFLDKGTFLFEPFMGMTTSQIRTIVVADPRLYIGTKLVPTRVRRANGTTDAERGKKLGRRQAGEDVEKGKGKGDAEVGGGLDVDGEAVKMRLVQKFLDARWAYRMPHFEPNPNALEGLFICGVRGEENDGEIEGRENS